MTLNHFVFTVALGTTLFALGAISQLLIGNWKKRREANRPGPIVWPPLLDTDFLEPPARIKFRTSDPWLVAKLSALGGKKRYKFFDREFALLSAGWSFGGQNHNDDNTAEFIEIIPTNWDEREAEDNKEQQS